MCWVDSTWHMGCVIAFKGVSGSLDALLHKRVRTYRGLGGDTESSKL